MSGKSILIIDDDEISLLILQNALEIEGYRVTITSDSFAATELFTQTRPDVVVLDVYMPEKDGFELIKEIRAVSTDVFIIAISANDLSLRVIKALGANVALPKDNMPDAVIDCLHEAEISVVN
jgi:CheY-like chemotaxis protein